MIEFIICEDDKELSLLYKNIIDKIMMNYDIDYQLDIHDGYDKNWKNKTTNDNFKVYILDLKTKEGTGLDAARYIREELDDWQSMIIIVTAFPEYKYEALAKRLMLVDFVSKLDNLMVVTSGIDKSNYEKTVNFITSNLLDLKKGKFTDKDIQIAKEIYDTSLEEIEESPLSMINEALSETIFDVEEISIRKEKMSKIRKSDITRVLKKINMDTVFLLEGVKNEEN